MKKIIYFFLISTCFSFSQSSIDWGNLQWPEYCNNSSSCTFYAQVYKAGVTPGNHDQINAWIGYSNSNTNPNTDNGSWTWVSASDNGTIGNNNEYTATLTPPN